MQKTTLTDVTTSRCAMEGSQCSLTTDHDFSYPVLEIVKYTSAAKVIQKVDMVFLEYGVADMFGRPMKMKLP